MEAQTTLTVTDNITEVLTMVLDFTSQRHKILIDNLNNINNKDYIPKDLDVNQFASTIDSAVTEHVINGRLALSDSDNIRFETNGRFIAEQINDTEALVLFENNNIEQYLDLQKRKLGENSLNSRLAAQLLKQKQAKQS